MQTSSERLVEVEAKTTQPPHHSHHRARQRKRLAAKVVLILALVVGGLAVSDFAFNAYWRADCMTEAEIDVGGVIHHAHVEPEPCDAEIAERDDRLQLDATGALVAVALLMGSILASRKLKPHRR